MNRHPARLVSTVCLLILLTAGAPLAAQTLWGIGYSGEDGPATLYSVNPATGAATTVGAVGFERCSGMDFNSSGVAFATCERSDGSNIPVLVTLDLDTGAGTEVGPTGLSGAVSDLSFRADGTLFAYDASNNPTHMLATINPVTGAGTMVGDTTLSFAGGNAMSFDLGGTLYHSQITGPGGPDLNTLNTTTGAATFVAQITPITDRLNSMDVNPDTGVLYAVLNEGNNGGGPRSLVTLDTGTATATVIGVTESTLDALAWQPQVTPLIPTLGTFGLVLLAAALALAAFVALRRL